jgi:hypothetical protein
LIFQTADLNKDTINRFFLKMDVLPWQLGVPHICYVDLQGLGVTFGDKS